MVALVRCSALFGAGTDCSRAVSGAVQPRRREVSRSPVTAADAAGLPLQSSRSTSGSTPLSWPPRSRRSAGAVHCYALSPQMPTGIRFPARSDPPPDGTRGSACNPGAGVTAERAGTAVPTACRAPARRSLYGRCSRCVEPSAPGAHRAGTRASNRSMESVVRPRGSRVSRSAATRHPGPRHPGRSPARRRACARAAEDVVGRESERGNLVDAPAAKSLQASVSGCERPPISAAAVPGSCTSPGTAGPAVGASRAGAAGTTAPAEPTGRAAGSARRAAPPRLGFHVKRQRRRST
jgi:hypothetical protein